MNWINALLVVILTTLATMFAAANEGKVSVGFANMTSAEVSLFVPIFIAFLIGFSGGMLSLSFSRRKHKIEIEQLRRENSLLQTEVNNLRNLPLQDET
ncbi:MAG: LapA family protein [Mariprofundaceae bacterium]|nr:LapA family protein [Mariprofundaceae bacterium]